MKTLCKISVYDCARVVELLRSNGLSPQVIGSTDPNFMYASRGTAKSQIVVPDKEYEKAVRVCRADEAFRTQNVRVIDTTVLKLCLWVCFVAALAAIAFYLVSL